MSVKNWTGVAAPVSAPGQSPEMVLGLASRDAPIEDVIAFASRFRSGLDTDRLREWHGRPRPAGWARHMARQTPQQQIDQARDMAVNVIMALMAPRARWAECAEAFLHLRPVSDWTDATHAAVLRDIEARAR